MKSELNMIFKQQGELGTKQSDHTHASTNTHKCHVGSCWVLSEDIREQ